MPNADLPVYGAQLPRLISANGVQIREDVLSTDDRSRKRAEEALASLHDDILPNLLEPNEAALYVIKAARRPSERWNNSLWGGMSIA